MKPLAFSRIQPHLLSWLSGILSLTTFSALGFVKPVQASSLSCNPSSNLIASCQSGVYNFSTRVAINVAFQQLNFQVVLNGTSKILVGKPVDAIINDPLLGTVGTVDGNLDVVPIELVSTQVSVPNPLNPNLTIAASNGDQVADLKPTPDDSTIPYESLYSAGAIVTSNNPSQASSFLNLSLEIQGTVLVTERNFAPFTITTTQPFTGIIPGKPIQYTSNSLVELFASGSDGQFWTGDEFVGSRLVPGQDISSILVTFTPRTVPEPSTVWVSLLLGLGMIGGWQKRENTQ